MGYIIKIVILILLYLSTSLSCIYSQRVFDFNNNSSLISIEIDSIYIMNTMVDDLLVDVNFKSNIDENILLKLPKKKVIHPALLLNLEDLNKSAFCGIKYIIFSKDTSILIPTINFDIQEDNYLSKSTTKCKYIKLNDRETIKFIPQVSSYFELEKGEYFFQIIYGYCIDYYLKERNTSIPKQLWYIVSNKSKLIIK